MDKLEALELLEGHIQYKRGKLPVYDEVIKITTHNENGTCTLTEYTFRYLLKVAYDL